MFSQLTVYSDTNVRQINRTKGPISKITIHQAAGNLPLTSYGSVFRERNTSANYAVDSDGKVGGYCPEEKQSVCSSSTANDQIAVTIEVSNRANNSNLITNAAYSGTVKLCADICRRNNIIPLTYIPGGTLKPQPNSKLTCHYWFKDKECPGDYILSILPQLVKDVNKLLNSPNQDVLPTIEGDQLFADPSMQMSESTTTVETETTVDVKEDSSADYTRYQQIMEYMKTASPYIMTLNEDTLYIDAVRFRAAKGIGVLLPAGRLFTESHIMYSRYITPNLENQITMCNKQGLPFGLVFTVRARNIEEAKREIFYMIRVIQLYDSAYGAWLKLELQNSKYINDQILTLYMNYLYRYGMMSKMGLYATRNQINNISWDKFQDYFWLWLIAPAQGDELTATSYLPGFFHLRANKTDKTVFQIDDWTKIVTEVYEESYSTSMSSAYEGYDQEALQDAVDSSKGDGFTPLVPIEDNKSTTKNPSTDGSVSKTDAQNALKPTSNNVSPTAKLVSKTTQTFSGNSKFSTKTAGVTKTSTTTTTPMTASSQLQAVANDVNLNSSRQTSSQNNFITSNKGIGQGSKSLPSVKRTIDIPSTLKQTGIIGDFTNLRYVMSGISKNWSWHKSGGGLAGQMARGWRDAGYPSSRNIALINGLYCVAMRTGIIGSTGDICTIVLSDNSTIDVIMIDEKGPDAGKWGHLYPNGTSIVEWYINGTPNKNPGDIKPDITGWSGKKVKQVLNRGKG